MICEAKVRNHGAEYFGIAELQMPRQCSDWSRNVQEGVVILGLLSLQAWLDAIEH